MDKGFKVNLSSNSIGFIKWFNIQATKTSKVRKILGFGRSAKVTIIDRTQSFDIGLKTDLWFSTRWSLTMSVLLSIVTLGFYVPVALGIVGSNVLGDKRFRDNFWKFLNTKIRELSSR